MKITRSFLFGMLGAFLLNSCSSDDDIVELPEEGSEYSNGFFVLNEGSQAA
ncbi:hypothetical protein LZ575_04850 [Antarcticibacterium sp. 1MA-6-2]|uniref:hypothetical protein n=1 Tax=Antarcticibacterium sp. 1MA-6-2 TaxID=2908210 RepID=UPI001F46B57D|nr:hypothetical protein [Antarcticibacterium sp. 1MA-6-2]UJH91967.1 hypothetical protein LZ575_04850 [Antarcticibacterium sp. 1MA-6-2]